MKNKINIISMILILFIRHKKLSYFIPMLAFLFIFMRNNNLKNR